MHTTMQKKILAIELDSLKSGVCGRSESPMTAGFPNKGSFYARFQEPRRSDDFTRHSMSRDFTEKKKLAPQSKCVGNLGAKSKIGTGAGNEKIILKTAERHYTR
jgi:hypothetical protein